ncbi:MAG TPA: hypothetical protein VHY20_00345, partial [Pirellulales bacterium]|nr:hypothetical protein [Pirellulales bacterium]
MILRAMLRQSLPAVLAAALLVPAWSPVQGGEPFRQMIDGLRERGYDDVALDYLAQMRTSDLLAEDLRPTVSYEEGLTLIDAAIEQRDLIRRGRELDQATAKLQEFVKANPAHPLAGSAALQLGNVIVERGRMAIDGSKRTSQPAKKPALIKQSRELLNQAAKVFAEAETKFQKQLDSFESFSEKDPKNKGKIEARDQLRRDAIQSQMYSGGVLQELARTYPAGSEEAKKYLQQAADKYETIFQAYRRRLAGLQARIKQGECYRELGDTRQALGMYADILTQPDDKEDFRELKATALYLSLEAWTSPGEKKAELAVIRGEEWLRHTKPGEERKAPWVAMHYFMALAYQQLADAAKPQDPKRSQELATAKEHAARAAREAGPFRDAAKKLVGELTGLDPMSQRPTTFAEALERGKTALDDMSARQTQVRI